MVHFLVAAVLLQGANQAAPELPPALRELAARYEIEVIARDPGFPVRASYGAIAGRAAARESLDSYAGLFAVEFGRYPVELVRRAKVRRVVLCDDLTFAGQRRNAVPDWEHDTLYLDISRGAYNQPYLRKVIHHEFFHLVDFHDDGVIYRDPAWAALNAATFRYGAGGRTQQEVGPTSVLSDKVPGFLNHYSTLGVEEDKAELFANLMVDPAHVAARAGADPILAAKAARLKDLLARFAPAVDAAFWDEARRNERDGERGRSIGRNR